MTQCYFKRLSTINRINYLASTFSDYQVCNIDAYTIEEYIKQFSAVSKSYRNPEILYESILSLLEEIDYWDYCKIETALNELIKKIDMRCKGDYVTNYIGGTEFSSYKILCKSNMNFTSLQNNLLYKQCSPNLVFIDDGAASGYEVVSVFQEWMGVPIEDRILKKHYVEELPMALKEKLIKSHIYLGYINFNLGAEQFIRSELYKIGIVNIHFVFINSMQKMGVKNKKYLGEAINCFEYVGRKLMLQKWESSAAVGNNWTRKEALKGALGYKDAQQLIVYSYNAPTYTLTALWKEGENAEFPWKPLFKRDSHK